MKAILKTSMLDKDGIHKKGDIIETENFDPFIMEALPDEGEPVEEKPKTTKKSKK